uniref:Uncharacterized protein n=1 Tax=Aegilops tauschii subsp. strangulata TaxID=200361 RepID=A0A453ARL6_AEGTS
PDSQTAQLRPPPSPPTLLPLLRPPHGEGRAMQAAAARARRLLASPAASGIQGILSASHRGCAAAAELVLLPHLENGFPASRSSPDHTRSFSSHLPR